MNSLPQRLQRLHETAGDRPALHMLAAGAPDRTVTYRELLCGAAGYAAALQAAGIQPGETVILILQHSRALVDSFFGAILHGAIPSILPFLTEKLSPDQYRRSLGALIEITRPAAVVTYPGFLADVPDAIPAGSSVRSVLMADSILPAEAV